jgi:hypothetical protein
MLVMGTCLALIAGLSILDAGPGYGWLAILAVIGFGGSAFYAQAVVDCPKCQVIFGPLVWHVAYPSIGLMPVRYCPHCALVLDELRGAAGQDSASRGAAKETGDS